MHDVSPPVLSPAETAWARTQHQAVLVTIRRDGSPQTSNVFFAFDGAVARVSVTADRAKTRNVARDGRAVLHILGAHFGQYCSIGADVGLGEVSADPGDQAGRDLLGLYEQVSGGTHPDPDDFYAAMVAEVRLLLTLTPTSVTSWGLPE